MITAILAAVALALVLIAITLPWLTVSILGQFSFSPIDMVRSYFTGRDSQSDAARPDLTQLASSFPDTFMSLVMSTIAYPIAISFLVIALVSSRLRKPALGSGGFSALTSAVAWIYSIESLKTHALTEASASGGFGQLLGTAFASSINIGVGTYLVITAGIIALVAYYLKNPMTKQSLAT